jgi:hypothetical protein
VPVVGLGPTVFASSGQLDKLSESGASVCKAPGGNFNFELIESLAYGFRATICHSASAVPVNAVVHYCQLEPERTEIREELAASAPHHWATAAWLTPVESE